MKAFRWAVALATASMVSSGAVAQSPVGSLRGAVFDSLLTGSPLVGAQVELLELGRRVTTDGRGVFRFDSLPAGRFTLSYSHESLTAIGYLPPERVVEVGQGVDLSVALATPAGASVFRRLCPATVEPKTGVLVGRVTEASTDSILGSAEVRAEWTETTVSRAAISRRPRVARALSEPAGRYQLCGVPTDVPVLIRLTANGVEGPPIELTMADRPIAVRALAIDLSADTSHGRARVVGRVTSGGAPIADAQVMLLGGVHVTRTDRDGAFLLDGLPAGSHTLEARAIGYGRQRRDIQLKRDQPVTVALSLTRTAVELPELTVRANRVSAALAGFDQRRRTGLGGTFLTRADIVRRGSIRVEDLFKGMAGIRVERIGGDDYQILSLRGGAGASAVCAPSVFIDGIRIPADPETGNGLPILPEEIEGIEVHPGINSAPPEYRAIGQNCGVILIWARRGGR